VPVAQISSKSGMGLKNITERVGMLGGKLKIDSTSDAGTRIAVVVPVAAEIGPFAPVV